MDQSGLKSKKKLKVRRVKKMKKVKIFCEGFRVLHGAIAAKSQKLVSTEQMLVFHIFI